MLFRSFDGDVAGGLSRVDFMKMLGALCISGPECMQIIEAIPSNAYQPRSDGTASHSKSLSRPREAGTQGHVGVRKNPDLISGDDLERIIAMSPRLLQEVESIRLKRLPPALRSMVQRAELDKQLDETQR